MLFLYLLIAFSAGLGAGYLAYESIEVRRALALGKAAQTRLDEARAEVDRLREEARRAADAELARRREALEQDLSARREEVTRREATADARAVGLSATDARLIDIEKKLAERDYALAAREAEVADAHARELDALQEAAKLTREEATARLLARLDAELGVDQARAIERASARAAEEAPARAREILCAALERVAVEVQSAATYTVVELPGDEQAQRDLKGRLVGRDGRNLRTFEEASGVDLIVDDTPGAVVLSSFDPLRREAARLSLEQLLIDGRIDPPRIEAAIETARRDLESHVEEAGRAAAQEADLEDVSTELAAHVGRLAHRHARGQVALRHAVETALLAGAIAAEMGLDARLARRAGLLHDVGRTLDHEAEGGHAAAGAALLKRLGEPEEVVLAAASHHGDPPARTPISLVVRAACALSAERPGARAETIARHVKRMRDLEAIAMAFPGVERAFAVMAGRELRVLVSAAKVADKLVPKVARDIAKKIEDEVSFPGEIRVTVVRETRVHDHAR